MPQPKPSTPRVATDEAESFTIVGIGASAGGLAALKVFFSHVPDDSDLAFVVVVHLSPNDKSHLADLLQPSSKMPVQQVTKTVPISKNRVYIIPPNANLDTIDTHLRLSELEADRKDRAPIDHFLRTLARVYDGHAVGVILTGTGSDGTLGIKEIKGQGGLTVVQDPNEAEFDGMPLSAIATGLIDAVLPLAKIPDYLMRFSRTQPRVPLVRAARREASRRAAAAAQNFRAGEKVHRARLHVLQANHHYAPPAPPHAAGANRKPGRLRRPASPGTRGGHFAFQ